MMDFESPAPNQEDILVGLVEMYPLAFAAAAVSNSPTGLALRRRGVSGLNFPVNDEEFLKAFTPSRQGNTP